MLIIPTAGSEQLRPGPSEGRVHFLQPGGGAAAVRLQGPKHCLAHGALPGGGMSPKHCLGDANGCVQAAWRSRWHQRGSDARLAAYPRNLLGGRVVAGPAPPFARSPHDLPEAEDYTRNFNSACPPNHTARHRLRRPWPQPSSAASLAAGRQRTYTGVRKFIVPMSRPENRAPPRAASEQCGG
jgi:hypothetical protein